MMWAWAPESKGWGMEVTLSGCDRSQGTNTEVPSDLASCNTTSATLSTNSSSLWASIPEVPRAASGDTGRGIVT